MPVVNGPVLGMVWCLRAAKAAERRFYAYEFGVKQPMAANCAGFHKAKMEHETFGQGYISGSMEFARLAPVVTATGLRSLPSGGDLCQELSTNRGVRAVLPLSPSVVVHPGFIRAFV